MLFEVATSRHLAVLDHAVAALIINRYRQDRGNARASLRFLQGATGAARPNIISAIRRLCDAGVLAVTRAGVGTRPTEYTLNFCYKASGIADDTASGTFATFAPSGIAHDTSCGIAGNTARRARGIAGDTESYLPVSAYKADLQVGGNLNDAFAAGRWAGLTPATAGAEAGGGFEDLWQAYGVRQKKADARAAYDKLSPDPKMHDRMVAAARAWRDAAGAGVTRMHLRRWLEDECWDCDPPAAFQRKASLKAAPAPRKAAAAKAAATVQPWNGDVPASTPRGRFQVEIHAATLIKESGEDLLCLDIIGTQDNGQPPFRCTQEIRIESRDPGEQARGQDMFERLRMALGLRDIEDTDELLFLPFTLKIDGAGIADYLPPAA